MYYQALKETKNPAAWFQYVAIATIDARLPLRPNLFSKWF